MQPDADPSQYPLENYVAEDVSSVRSFVNTKMCHTSAGGAPAEAVGGVGASELHQHCGVKPLPQPGRTPRVRAAAGQAVTAHSTHSPSLLAAPICKAAAESGSSSFGGGGGVCLQPFNTLVHILSPFAADTLNRIFVQDMPPLPLPCLCHCVWCCGCSAVMLREGRLPGRSFQRLLAPEQQQLAGFVMGESEHHKRGMCVDTPAQKSLCLWGGG